LKIEENIENIDIQSFVGSSDAAILNKVKIFLGSSHANSSKAAWLTAGTSVELELINLVSRVHYVREMLDQKTRKLKADIIESGDLDEVRTQGERGAYLYLDSQYRDLMANRAKLDSLYLYLDALLWSLKGCLKSVRDTVGQP